jgi:hypothetical protein
LANISLSNELKTYGNIFGVNAGGDVGEIMTASNEGNSPLHLEGRILFPSNGIGKVSACNKIFLAICRIQLWSFDYMVKDGEPTNSSTETSHPTIDQGKREISQCDAWSLSKQRQR